LRRDGRSRRNTAHPRRSVYAVSPGSMATTWGYTQSNRRRWARFTDTFTSSYNLQALETNSPPPVPTSPCCPPYSSTCCRWPTPLCTRTVACMIRCVTATVFKLPRFPCGPLTPHHHSLVSPTRTLKPTNQPRRPLLCIGVRKTTRGTLLAMSRRRHPGLSSAKRSPMRRCESVIERMGFERSLTTHDPLGLPSP
jgi:hypothetical protein